VARRIRVYLLVIGWLELLEKLFRNFLACLLFPKPTLGYATEVTGS